MINLTIDGNNISVPDGTTVLKAAKSVGIEIPTLCDHQQLTPYGGCRLCVVEIEGARTLQTSCTLPVMENMVIHTNTERVREARRFILTMIFSDRNHFCPYCVVNDGDCELQQAAYHEEMTHWPIQPNWKPYVVDASHPYIVQDHNRCILCRRCVRACSELVGNYTLGVEERGANSLVMADLGTPLGESSCISCGVCVQVCPTGSLIDRWSAYRGQEKDLQEKETICIGCSIGCGVTTFTKDNHLVRIEGNWSAKPNMGLLCKVGRFLPLDDQNERVLTPMVREDGKLISASWEEAMAKVAKNLKATGEGKTTGLINLISPRLPLEAIHLSKEIFANHLKAKLVTSLEEGKNTNLAYAIREKLGKPYQSQLEDIETADAIVLLNADLLMDHEVASFLVKRTVARGANLLNIGSSENALDNIAAISLINNAKSSVLDTIGGISAALIKSGMNKVKSTISGNRALEHAALITEIPAEDFDRAAQLLGHAEKILIIFGADQQAGIPTMVAEKIIEFAKISGAITQDWVGLFSLKGKANSYAAAQYGLDQPVHFNGEAAYIAMGDEEASQRLIQSLEKSPFVVVQAAYTSRLTAMADVVFPATIWGEEEGHYMNINGTVQKAEKFREPGENIRTNHEILHLLARHLKIDNRCKQDWLSPLKSRPLLSSIGY